MNWFAVTLTRHSELQPTVLPLKRLVEQALDAANEVRPERAPVVHLDLAHKVRADEHLTRQLLSNLVNNAIKYTPEDRRPVLTISSRKEEPDWVVVEVADQGRGIPEEDLEAVFHEYVRSNRDAAVADGNGIGLALCRETVHRHGGWIRAENNKEGGASLVFALPGV